MKPNIGINGFGRIGRVAARILLDSSLDLVAINSPAGIDSNSYLLQYDSVYGKLLKKVIPGDDFLKVNNKKIFCFQEAEPASIPWQKAKVDLVLECSGKFLTAADCAGHFKGKVKRVILSAPAKDETPTYVLGVNEQNFNPKERIVSCSSCTTNCLAVVLKVLDDNFSVIRGNMTTIHAITDSQNLLDNSHKKSVRQRRAAMQNLIPTSSGSAKDLVKLFPHLKDKLPCRTVRIPLPTVSMVDLVVEVNKQVDKEVVNKAFVLASQKTLKGILDVESSELVSSDFIGSPFSAVVDPFLTDVIDENLVHVVAWYDNEWGYTSRLVELAEYISKQ